MNKYFLSLFFCLAVFSSCKKDCDKPADPRDEFVGQYQCRETISCYGSCGTCYTERDTVLSVYYGNTDTTILFIGREVWLDSTGSYYAYHYGLNFRNDSVFSSYMNGGLGCGAYETYFGVKIADTP